MQVIRLSKSGAFHFADLVIDFDACWIYIGPAYWQDGYPIINRHRKNWIASRFAWFIVTGRDYYKKEVHHKCENKACVNPFHLIELSGKKHRRYHNKQRAA